MMNGDEKQAAGGEANRSRLMVIPLGDQMSPGEMVAFRPWVPELKWERSKAFLHWQDRQRTLLGYTLASYMLGRRGLAREEISLAFDYYGKPHLEGQEDLFFNLSHAGDWVACGVHDRPIGVDVEKIQEIDLQVAERFFAPQEVDDLFSLPSDQRLDYFFTLWTLKESYIKAVGRGISIPLDSFWFRVDLTGEIEFAAKDDQREWIFQLYDLTSEYKLATCVLGEGLPGEVERASWRQILK